MSDNSLLGGGSQRCVMVHPEGGDVRCCQCASFVLSVAGGGFVGDSPTFFWESFASVYLCGGCLCCPSQGCDLGAHGRVERGRSYNNNNNNNNIFILKEKEQMGQ